MGTYYFNLKEPEGRHLDPEGTDLADDAQAKEHACQVACELMLGREVKTRCWRVEICDAGRSPVAEVLFAAVDPLVADLHPLFRNTVEQASARTAALFDAITDVRNAFQQLRATMAKSDAKPYLATLDGRKLDNY